MYQPKPNEVLPLSFFLLLPVPLSAGVLAYISRVILGLFSLKRQRREIYN